MVNVALLLLRFHLLPLLSKVIVSYLNYVYFLGLPAATGGADLTLPDAAPG
jgi:hypothetical protein